MKSPSAKATIWYFVTALLVSGIIARMFFIDTFTVRGDSMAPTIVDGDYVFVWKSAYAFSTPVRGDIIVGNFRSMDNRKVIKRVHGLPREWVFIENGIVYTSLDRYGERAEVGKVDTETIVEEMATSTSYNLDLFEYFVLGDNGLSSLDSRELGPIDSYRIDGRVAGVFRVKDFSFITFN